LLESNIKDFICQRIVYPLTGNNSSETSHSSDAMSSSTSTDKTFSLTATDTTSSSRSSSETKTSQRFNSSEKSSLIWILIIVIIIFLIIIAVIGILCFVLSKKKGGYGEGVKSKEEVKTPGEPKLTGFRKLPES
jgi:ATP-dependent Zn protease